ncbi:MAG: hypothetical protein KA914_01320 [Ottowia sp.]|jgi:hypothetical protein|nr:hypothetical protein [Ottowia sp.]
MNNDIQKLYLDIASSVAAELADMPWVSTEYTFMAIARYSSQNGFFIDEFGQKSKTYAIESPGLEGFGLLRTAMAKLGSAWYTAIFRMTPDGKFNFEFDYDHLPAFDIVPSPSKWRDEFKQYPRPELQAQIQDWMDSDENDALHDEVVQRLADLQRTSPT